MTDAAPPTQPLALAPEAITPDPQIAERFSGRFRFSGSLRRRAVRGTLINAAFTVGVGALGLIKGFVLAGFLSRSDYGVWGVIAVSLSTLLWLKQAGIGDRFVQQDEADQELAFQHAFTMELILTAGCVVLIAAAVPLLVLIYHLPELILPSAVIAGALLVAVFQAPLWIYYRRMEFARQRALAAVDPVVGLIVSIALAVAGAGYWAFVGGLAAGACAASAAAMWQLPYKLRLRFDRRAARGYLSFSGPLLIGGGATFVMAWSALADNVASFSERVDEVITGALYPAICAVKDRIELLYESLVKSNRLALMWAVPFGIGLTLFSHDLVRFGIGERWRSAIVVLQLYGVAAALNHVGFNWTAYFRALGRTRPIATQGVAATVAFLVTGIPLLLILGLRGFAIGIVAQSVAALVIRAYYLHQLFPGFGFLRHAARSFLPTVPAVAAVLVVRALHPGGVAGALGELALYGVVTVAATWSLESALLRETLAQLLGVRAPAGPREAIS